MKSGTRKVLAAVIVLITIAVAVLSVFGVGSLPSIGEKMKYGLDINGGVYVLLEAETDETGAARTQLMEQTKSVLENRVNAMGISEATVSIEGTKRIRVEMPGVEDAEEAIKQIGRTAQLRFLLADGTVIMNGDAVRNASFSTDSENGRYEIDLEFSAEGTDKFAEGSAKAFSGSVNPTIRDSNGAVVDARAIVIMLDDEVISAPVVNEVINSRTCRITRGGGFPQDEAAALSALIRGGALPASLTEINSSVETATIGANALHKSVIAGIIGLGLVFLIMLAVYGLLGLIADFALMLYVEIVLWIMAGLGAVLTLPGIAGIILSIGMAVDSNVIIFSRIREEIAKGKSVRVATDAGFRSALTTVIDAQTTTLIAAFVLYLIGTTSVRGFALTLMIGTVCSIFTAVFITQIFVTMLAESHKYGKPQYFGMKADNTPKLSFNKVIHFLQNRKRFYAISLVIILLGLGCAAFKGFNYGIDFTGGTMIQLEMGEQVDIDELKAAISEYDLNPTIVYAGDDNTQVVIRTIKALQSDERSDIIATIGEKYGIDESAILAAEEFGPTVGQELRNNAIRAIVIAALCMLIYIRFRFKTWKYGLAAVGGLAHDVLITLALYAIFGFTINNPFIAGILTVVGYSINDTIVIFDRIRENGKFYKKKELAARIDDSINQTLSRSVMTSVTTLIVMIPLFLMISSEIRQFLIPLIIGVLAGTYSSIFICSPLYYELTRKESMSRYEEQRERQEKERRKSKGSSGIVK